MTESIYDISVVFSPPALSDDQVDRLMGADADCIVAEVGGLATISSTVEGTSGVDAARRFVDLIRRTLPQIELVRLDPDLVSIPDISDRTGRTRESVRLLVEGKRGPGKFPTPEGIVGGGIRIWRWAVVQQWFCEHLPEELDEPLGLLPDEALAVDRWMSSTTNTRDLHQHAS